LWSVPLTNRLDVANAATMRPIVIALSRRGVTQEKCLAAMNARVPEAVAPAVITVAMHCMHTAREYRDNAGMQRGSPPAGINA
jgi:hypothetical protein